MAGAGGFEPPDGAIKIRCQPEIRTLLWLWPRGGHSSRDEVDLWRLKAGQRDIETLDRQKVDQLAELDRWSTVLTSEHYGFNLFLVSRAAVLGRLAWHDSLRPS
jgi:hypothetical protein